MTNVDIREEVRAAGLKLWEVAYALGIKSDANFSRKLRKELTSEEKAKIRAIIGRLKAASNQEEGSK